MKLFMKIGSPTLLLLSIFSLISCGGGTSTSPNTKGSGTNTVSGVVTAAANADSLTVNGVTFDTTNATVTVDGVAADTSAITPGMVVSVEGSISDDGTTGIADHINASDEVEGLVFSANVIGGVGTLDVMGQTIAVDLETIFESEVLGITTVDQLTVGNIVEVYGLSSGGGVIVATRIELESLTFEVGDELEVKGMVANLNTIAKTFIIGGLIIDYSTAELDFPFNVVLSDGLIVEAEADATQLIVDSLLTGGPFKADEVELEEEDQHDEDDEISIEGIVSNLVLDVVTGLPTFYINNQLVLTTKLTTVEHGTLADIVDGALVEVEGAYDASGALVADEVEIETRAGMNMPPPPLPPITTPTTPMSPTTPGSGGTSGPGGNTGGI